MKKKQIKEVEIITSQKRLTRRETVLSQSWDEFLSTELLQSRHKYDGFCTVPEYVNHRMVIDGFLNLYEPIEHKPIVIGCQ